MKSTVKIIMVVFMTGICSFGYAQERLDVYLHESKPSEWRTIIEERKPHEHNSINEVINEGNPSIKEVSKAVNILVCRFDVPKDSRVAINMARVSDDIGGVDEEDLKDKIIDILLEKGYKVVAKGFSDSDTYNFPAVDYYINAKLTRNFLRMQVVNVSTGEYEGNATITF